MKEVITNNKELVNYFTKAHYWIQFLETWRASEKIKHGLKTFTETRWFSFAKVCLSVQSHELGFRKCVEKSGNRSDDSPAIKKSICDLVFNCRHFASNKILVRFLEPVVDAIAALEHANTTVGDVWKELIGVYMKLKNIEVDGEYLGFKSHCISMVDKRSKVFEQPVYLVGFFLSPGFQIISASRKFDLVSMTQTIVKIAKGWKFKQVKCKKLIDQVLQYYNSESYFKMVSKCKFIFFGVI